MAVVIMQQRQFQASVFKEYLRNKIVALLDSVPGKKMLLLEEETSEALEIVANLPLLYEHGVAEQGGINFVARQEPVDKSISNVLALVTPTVKAVNSLVEIFKKSQDKTRRTYVLAFWPKRTTLVRAYLDSLGLASIFELRDFAFDLLPLENDLYSLQMKSFRQIFLQRDYSYYGLVAESIHRLQAVYGKIHNVYGKGQAAKIVYDILRQKEQQVKLDAGFGEIETLVIIDRSIDLLTPIIKQLVYEALIDDIYGITGIMVKVPARVLDEKERDQSKMRPLLLQGDNDPIFQLIREKNIQVCMPLLSKKLAEIKEMQDTLRAGRQSNIRIATQMLKKMDSQKTLSSRHISIVDSVLKYVKEIDFQKEIMMQQRAIIGSKEKELLEYCETAASFTPPLHRLLRLLCIASLTDKGLPAKSLRQLCIDLVQIYGMGTISTLSNLFKVGLLAEKEAPGNYPFEEIRKEMKLMSEAGINYQNPQDISFAFGGFAPLTVRLVQQAIRHNWRALGKAFKYIPGDTVIPASVSAPNSARPVVAVYFVGGVTYSQVAALRVLGRLQGKQLVILTTEMLNGDRLIKSLID